VGVFLQPEWGNFVRSTLRQPWWGPHYAGGLLWLVLRRFANTLRHRAVGKDHRGLKRWPPWLGQMEFGEIVCEQDVLSFPVYALASREHLAQAVPRLRFEPGDPEGYFAAHRWGNCFAAALENETVAEAALNEALSWIRNQPAKHDAAWEPYSSCERVANLTVMLAVHQGCWRALDAGSRSEIASFLAESARWINDRLEYYGIARTNNHILNNARALVVAGSALGDEALVERGLLLFARMANELFQPGGFLRERSSHYQLVVTNWLMDTLHFANSAKISRERARVAMVELAALSETVVGATALLVSAGEGLNTHIGDISPDNHPAAAIFRLQHLYPGLFPAASVYTDGRRDEWLFVSAGKHQLLACGVPVEYPFDYTTHGHGDLGSFVWAYDHRPLLVDAGRASYITDKQTELQCGPSGHNSLMVQGLAPLADTLLSNGRWCPRPYAAAVVSLEHESGSGFFLEHDGFARICGVGKHSRSVQIIDEGIEVVDTLKGVGLVEIDMFWHFAPDLSALEEAPYAASGSGFRVLIEESGTNLGTADIEWDEYPYSAAYGEVQNAFVLHTKRKVSLPWSVTTTLKVLRCAE
jgi:hypothetical protein